MLPVPSPYDGAIFGRLIAPLSLVIGDEAQPGTLPIICSVRDYQQSVEVTVLLTNQLDIVRVKEASKQASAVMASIDVATAEQRILVAQRLVGVGTLIAMYAI